MGRAARSSRWERGDGGCAGLSLTVLSRASPADPTVLAAGTFVAARPERERRGSQSKTRSWRTAEPSARRSKPVLIASSRSVAADEAVHRQAAVPRQRQQAGHVAPGDARAHVRALQRSLLGDEAERRRGTASGPGRAGRPRPSSRRGAWRRTPSRGRATRPTASTTVSPPPAVSSRIVASEVRVVAADGVRRAELQREVELGVDDVDRHDRVASGEPRAHHGAEADAAEPEDDRRGTRPRRRRVDEGPDTGQDGATEHRGGGEVRLAVDPDQRRLRDDRVVGERRDAEVVVERLAVISERSRRAPPSSVPAPLVTMAGSQSAGRPDRHGTQRPHDGT